MQSKCVATGFLILCAQKKVMHLHAITRCHEHYQLTLWSSREAKLDGACILLHSVKLPIAMDILA
jgi:hypothetical protein